MTPRKGPRARFASLKKVLLTLMLVGAFVAAMLQLDVGDDAAPTAVAPPANAADFAAAQTAFSQFLAAQQTAAQQIAAQQAAAQQAAAAGTPAAAAAGTPAAAAAGTPAAAAAAGTPAAAAGTPSATTGGATGAGSTGTTGTTGTSGTTGAQPGIQRGAADSAAPVVVISVGSKNLTLVLKNGFTFTVNCNEPCDVSAVLDMARKLAKSLGIAAKPKNVSVGKAKSRLGAAGRKKVTIKLTNKAKRRLRRTRRVKLRLRVGVKDRAGNKARTSARSVTLTR